MSSGSAVGIETGYVLDDRRGQSSESRQGYRQDRLWGSPNLLSKRFLQGGGGGKAAEAWSWPLNSN
jgi:hypothetical protein